MNGKRRPNLLFAAAALLACALQVIGLVRYVNRLPDDWVGITLYAATIIAFALVAVGFYVQARRS